MEKVLNNENLNLLEKLSRKYTLRIFSFDEKLTEETLAPDPETGLRTLPEAKGNLAKFKRRYKGLEIIPISAMDGIGLEEATEKIHDVLVEEGLYDEGNEA